MLKNRTNKQYISFYTKYLFSTDVRRNSYYVFINKVVADVNELTSLSPVYYESDSRPSAQNIIMFPGGISGKQLYIYKNTSGPSQYNNSILDICEIEIWGIYDAIVTAYYICEIEIWGIYNAIVTAYHICMLL